MIVQRIEAAGTAGDEAQDKPALEHKVREFLARWGLNPNIKMLHLTSLTETGTIQETFSPDLQLVHVMGQILKLDQEHLVEKSALGNQLSWRRENRGPLKL